MLVKHDLTQWNTKKIMVYLHKKKNILQQLLFCLLLHANLSRNYYDVPIDRDVKFYSRRPINELD